MTFDNNPIDWNAEGTEPSQELKASGFSAGQKLAAKTLNFLVNFMMKAVGEIQTLLNTTFATKDEISTGLSDKVDKTQYASTTQAGVIKLKANGSGTNVSGIEVDSGTGVARVHCDTSRGTYLDGAGRVGIQPATQAEAEAGTNGYKPIVPSTLKYILDKFKISPAFTGTPTAPTAANGDDSTQIATTEFVQNAADLKADKNNPSFTGTVTIKGDVQVGKDTQNILHLPNSDYSLGYAMLNCLLCSIEDPGANVSYGGTDNTLIQCVDAHVTGGSMLILMNVREYTLDAPSLGYNKYSRNCVAINSINPSLRENNVVLGNYNTSEPATTDLFIIGNGSRDARSNAFRVTSSGNVYGLSAYHSTGADYAEYFEWVDMNLENEDRRGLFVTLVGDKIQIANSDDEVIGIISSAPSMVGNAYDDVWQGMYLTDIFGQIITETVQDDVGDTIERPVINPQYDPNMTYVPRSERPEWAKVGLLGQLVVKDDGTCVAGGRCSCTDSGTATADVKGYRVLKRLDNNHITILFR